MRRMLNRRLVRLCASAALLTSLAVLGAPNAAGAQAEASGHVYVLNNAPGQPNSITVFARAADGTLRLERTTPIGGLGGLAQFANGTQGSLILAPDGQRLFAADAGSNQVSVLDVRAGQLTVLSVSGSAGAGPVSLTGPRLVHAAGAVPFGMAFTQQGGQPELIVDDATGGPSGAGGVTAYSLTDRLSPLEGPVFDQQLAPCWMVITGDGRYAYASNADSRSISGYRIGADGGLALLNADGMTATTPGDTFPLEESLSRNSQFLYVLDSRLLLAKPGPATLSGFRINSDGQLSQVVDPGSITLPFSAIGLAAD